MRIGVISDTHGLLRAEAVAALRGSRLILHAGDIGGQEILDQLSDVAPVLAVRGNNDTGDWAVNLPIRLSVSVRGKTITIVHDVADFDSGSRSRSHVVVSGHSHKPGYRVENGILFFNPGSAGPRRFRLPITVGELSLTAGRISPRLVTIAASEPLRRGRAARSQGQRVEG